MLIIFVCLCLGACAGAEAVDGGEDFNPDPRPMAQTLVYECTGIEVIARVGPGEMALWLPDRYLVLSQVRAASGTKYVEGDVLFWTKGDDLLLEVGPERYTDCVLNRLRAPWEDARRRGVDFRATGNEPGWHLEIKEGRQLLYVGDYGARRLLLEAPEKTADDSGIRYRARSANDAIEVQVSDTPCTDSMQGTAFPATVEVQVNGRFYQGCGMALDHPWE
jgi:putative lipoprotein